MLHGKHAARHAQLPGHHLWSLPVVSPPCRTVTAEALTKGTQDYAIDDVLAKLQGKRSGKRMQPGPGKADKRKPAASPPTTSPPKPRQQTGGSPQAAKGFSSPGKQKGKQPGKQRSADSLSLDENDKLFDEVADLIAARAADLELDEDDGDDESTTAIWSSTPSTFKGFGAPPRSLASPSAAHASSGTAGKQQPQQQQAQLEAAPQGQGARHKPSSTVPPLRVFLYAAEASRTQEALQQAGWAQQVVVSEDLRSAHCVVATKTTRQGKHNKLQQGERTARNAGIPFVCVGRQMTRDNLVLALAPVLQGHRAKHGVVHEAGLAHAIAKAGVSEAVATHKAKEAAAKLQAGWKEGMLRELGLTATATGS